MPAFQVYRHQYVKAYYHEHGTHVGMLTFSQWLAAQ